MAHKGARRGRRENSAVAMLRNFHMNIQDLRLKDSIVRIPIRSPNERGVDESEVYIANPLAH